MTAHSSSKFKRGVVRPIVCIAEGWALIKDQYWIFFAMALITIFVGGSVPLGILMGPMMCGLYLTLFMRMRRKRVEFAMLFKGFDYFVQGIVASLLHAIPAFIAITPFTIVFVTAFIGVAPDGMGRRRIEPAIFFGGIIVFAILMILVMIVLGILFTFAYPLIVERDLSGVEAVKLSFKAALANFGGLLGLALLNSLMGFAGVLLCYVGVFLVLPISFASIAAAYRQVFGLTAAPLTQPPSPPQFG